MYHDANSSPSQNKWSSRNAVRAGKAAKISLRKARKAILDDICLRIEEARKDNNGSVPHAFVSSMVQEMGNVCDGTITRDVINYSYKTWVTKRKLISTTAILANAHDEEGAIVDVDETRKKGGRPKGSTEAKKKHTTDAIIAAKNEIAILFEKAREQAGGARVSKGCIKLIIDDIKRKRKLPEGTIINMDTIRKRVSRNRAFSHGKCATSPLIDLEHTLISIIIQMARIRQCLTPSKGIRLVNSMIDGTADQVSLVQWKDKYSTNSLGTVGRGYWRGFMERNGHLICSKRGAKYELDRASWSTYANFADMYSHIIDEMVDAKLAVKLETPVWKDRAGNVCMEKDALGCKVTHDILRPDMCIVGDEVGGNISMKGDGHAGGELYLCAKGTIPQKKVSNKDKHFTLMGLTSLDGAPVMCVLIITGKRAKAMTELGIDPLVEMIGLETDEDFF